MFLLAKIKCINQFDTKIKLKFQVNIEILKVFLRHILTPDKIDPKINILWLKSVSSHISSVERGLQLIIPFCIKIEQNIAASVLIRDWFIWVTRYYQDSVLFRFSYWFHIYLDPVPKILTRSGSRVETFKDKCSLIRPKGCFQVFTVSFPILLGTFLMD